MYINADIEEPNCMTCINQDRCEGQQCGPEYAWRRYARYEDDVVEENEATLPMNKRNDYGNLH